YWLTVRQLTAIGGRLRPGEHGTPIVFWKFRDTPVDPNARDRDVPHAARPFLRYYLVWNTEQCELPASLLSRLPLPQVRSVHPSQHCETVVRQMPQRPAIIHKGHRACYLLARDRVCMPAPGRFESADAYYVTLFHELCHASGHPRRLNRPSLQTPCPFGSAPYSEEKLVAEMGAALLGGVTGIDSVILDNSAASIDVWLSRLRKDTRLLLRAASQGQKAADFILGITADRVPPATSRIADTAVACSP